MSYTFNPFTNTLDTIGSGTNVYQYNPVTNALDLAPRPAGYRYNPFTNNLDLATPLAPLVGPWALFNGSAATPFSTNGAAWIDSFLGTTQTIALDSTRFAFIYGDPVSIVIGTYSNINTAPTFGTAVKIDSTLDGDFVVANGCLLSANTIYVAYFDPTTDKRYGRVFTISGTTLTAHTSTNIDTGNLSVYPSKNIASLSATHVIEVYSSPGQIAQAQVMAIDGSFNVTFGTPLDLTPYNAPDESNYIAIVALSSTSAAILAPDASFFPTAILLSISGTAITLTNALTLENANTMQGGGSALASGTSTTFVAAWNTIDNVSGTLQNQACLVTNTGGVLSNGTILPVFAIFQGQNNDENLTMLDLIYTGNVGEFLLFQQIESDIGTVFNDFVQYIQVHGTTLEAGERIAVNVNSYTNTGFFPSYYGSMLTPDLCAFPSLTWDGTNYGCVVLSDMNTMQRGDVIFFVEADSSVTTVTSASLGPATGTVNASSVIVTGVDLSNILIPGSNFEVNGDPYTVATIVFGTFTLITTTTPLINNYSSSPVTAQLITQIVDKSPNAYVFTQATTANQPITGKDQFGNPSIICYGNNGNPTFLECNAMKYPPQFTAYVSCVCEATDGAVYLVTGVSNDNILYDFDIQYTAIQLNTSSGNLVGSYVLNGQNNLVECLRSPYASTCIFNGSLNGTLDIDIFALGNLFNYLIGSRPDLAVPFAGSIYAVKLRWGQPTDAEILADRQYFMNKYEIP